MYGIPDRCSLCIGVTARVVTLDDGYILIDGMASRPNVEPVSPQVESSRRRGSKRR
jgi:hypothetical protein